MNDMVQAFVLGIVEGLTEFLPVSSTGHLLIAEHWLGKRSELFNVAIQAGAILAAVLVFWPRISQLLLGLKARDNRDYLAKLLFAFVISGTGGFAAKQLGVMLPETVAPVAGALLIGGLLILLIEWRVSGRPAVTELSWSAAFWVGAAIFAAMLAGLTSRPAATEFAFLVGIPTMFAATGYEFMKLRGHDSAAEDWSALALAFAVAAVVAFAAVKWLLRYIQTHRFTVFAWYRIAAGLFLLIVAR